MKLQFAAVALAALMAVPAGASTVVTNGSFETNPLQPNQSWNVYSSIAGWKTITGAGIEVQRQSAAGIAPQDGNFIVELDSHNNTKFGQTVTLAAGNYMLDFNWRARTTDASTNGLAWSLGGLTNGSILSGSTTWSLLSTTFTVTKAGSYLLAFAGTGKSDGIGMLLDNVSITPSAVPVPAAGVLLMGALGGLGLLRRRKAA